MFLRLIDKRFSECGPQRHWELVGNADVGLHSRPRSQNVSGGAASLRANKPFVILMNAQVREPLA